MPESLSGRSRQKRIQPEAWKTARILLRLSARIEKPGSSGSRTSISVLMTNSQEGSGLPAWLRCSIRNLLTSISERRDDTTISSLGAKLAANDEYFD